MSPMAKTLALGLSAGTMLRAIQFTLKDHEEIGVLRPDTVALLKDARRAAEGEISPDELQERYNANLAS